MRIAFSKLKKIQDKINFVNAEACAKSNTFSLEIENCPQGLRHSI
jgi:hypothetical protein